MYMYMYTYIYIYVCVCVCVCICVHIYTYIYICIHVYIYIYIYIERERESMHACCKKHNKSSAHANMYANCHSGSVHISCTHSYMHASCHTYPKLRLWIDALYCSQGHVGYILPENEKKHHDRDNKHAKASGTAQIRYEEH